MTDSSLLGLPYLDAAQSLKHITHNEALSVLDVSLQIALQAMNVVTPPGSPVEGYRVHVGAGATGDFVGQAGKIAAWQSGAWRFLLPRAGWIAWITATQSLMIYDGAAWLDVATTVHELGNLTKLAVGTSADPGNPLSAKLNSALFAARDTTEGGTGDLRMVLNKPASARTLSQLYQTNYSGRAETGLIADDHYRIKVSANGSSWQNAMDIDPASGLVSFPSGLSAPGLGMAFKRLETFNSSGTFTKQAGDVLYFVIAIGGGGGGGSGRRSAAATQAGGGAGGNGAHIVEDWIAAASVAATTSVTIGAGGSGGPAAADSTNGNAGAAGGTTIALTLYARGGAGGSGGTNTVGGAAAATGVDAYTISRYRESAGGAGGASALGGGSAHAGGASGGSGGGGLTTADVESAGIVAGTGDMGNALTVANGGTAGTPASPNGGAGGVPAAGRFGSGGGGGASKAAAAAGNGGAGSQAGGGGGGGGGGRNGQTGGAGGAGGAGRVLIYVYG